MPNEKEIVESFVSSFPKVLIVNEIGAIGSHLVDSLLALGCQIFYFGDKKNDEISHLLGKNNFEFQDTFGKIQKHTLINYVFYLTNKEGKYLEKITRLVKDKKVKFLLVFPREKEIPEKLMGQFSKLGIDVRICLYQEFYGPRIKEGIFSSIIKSAVFGEKIKIPRSQTEETNLVFYLDFIKGVNRAIFAPETSGKILDISGQSISFLSFLGKLEREIKNLPPVEFSEEKEKVKSEGKISFKNDKFGWQPEIELEEGINKTVSWWERKKEELFLRKKISPPFFLKAPQLKRPKILFGLSIFVLLVSLFFLVPLFILIINLSLARTDLARAKIEWENGNLSQLRIKLRRAANAIKRSKKTIGLTSPFYSLVGLEKGVEQIEIPLEVGSNILDSVELLLKCGDAFFPFFSSLLKGEKVSFSDKEKEINYYLEKSYLTASLAWASLQDETLDQNISNFFGFSEYQSLIEKFLPRYRQKINQARTILPLISGLIGEKNKRNYLILLQDNFELRPTGGFLGSVVLLTFDQGQLSNFEVKDVSQLDSQLRGQVNPPQRIKDYLGQENWYLRDANWFPDFPTSAAKIEWFLMEETGRTVDGVFAFNLSGTKEILKALGEVYLPETKEKINAKNIGDYMIYGSHKSSFPGSTQNSDLLGQIIETVYEKVKTEAISHNNNWLEIIKAIYTSLEKKDLLIFLHQPEESNLFKTFNLDGSIIKTSGCQKIINNCFEDYLFINEVNLGFNKANYFIKRMINQAVSINEEGEVSNSLKIYYQNLSLSESRPQGRYKTYIRTYLPSSASIESLMANDPNDPTFWVQIPLKDVDLTFENEKLSLGFLMEIPIKSKRIVEIKYSNKTPINLEKSFSYLLLTQKQSGSGETPYTLSVSYPSQIKPLKILPKGVLSAGKILINENLDKDKIFRVDFGK